MQKKIIVFLIIALFLSTSFISISAKEIETKVKKPCPTLAKKWFIVTIKNQDGDLIQGVRVIAEYGGRSQLGPTRTDEFGQVDWRNHWFPNSTIIRFKATHFQYGKATLIHDDDVVGLQNIQLTLKKGFSKQTDISLELPEIFKLLPLFSNFFNL